MATSGKGNIDYDIDAVIAFCQDGAQNGIHNLIKDLNLLVEDLDACQDKFHCKGGDSANAVIRIYKGFSTAIGKSNGKQAKGASGLGALAAASAMLVDSVYADAMNDKKAQEMSDFNF